MKKRKILALVLTLALLVTQFSFLGVVSAETVDALSGRKDFELGVAIHKPTQDAYNNQYKALLDAEALGSTLIRTDSIESDDNVYDANFAKFAAQRNMDVMFHVELGISLKDADGNLRASSDITTDEYQAVYDRFYSKATALKDYNAYIQIGNELDIVYYKDTFLYNGTSEKSYNDVSSVAIAIYLADKAVKDANNTNGSDIKTIVNFGYNHYGFLKAVKNVKIDATNYTVTTATNAVNADWDIIGWDYYSNMYDNLKYSDFLNDVANEFDKDIIICESNLTPKTEKTDGTIEYAEDIDWLKTFVKTCYENQNVIGFVVYELYDEPAHSLNGWNKESHFGLIDKDGNKKDTYNLICGLYGGTGVVVDSHSEAINTVSEYPEYASIEISKDGITTVFGAKYVNAQSKTRIDLASPVDLSDAERIEFDIYIADATLFNELGNTPCLVIETSKNVRNAYRLANKITTDGWNHVVFNLSECAYVTNANLANINSIYIAYWSNSDNPNPIGGFPLKIANICGVITEISQEPAYPSDALVEISKEGATDTFEEKNVAAINLTSTPVNLSNVDQIEFDIYIESFEDYLSKDGMAGKLFFVMSSDANDKTANRKAYRMRALIKEDGWNHIVINLSGAGHQSTGSLDLSSVKWVYLCFWDHVPTNKDFASSTMRIANLCGSKYRYNKDVPEYPENAELEISKTGYTGHWNYEFDEVKKKVCFSTTASSVNLTTVDQVEFDIYVEDYEALRFAAGSGDDLGRNLLFTLSSGGYDKNTAGWRFHTQITHNGWNHVVIDLSSTKNYLTYADLSAVTHVGFQYFSSIDNDWLNDGKNGMATCNIPLRIVNVCGTMKEINRLPDYPSDAVVEISKEGIKNNWSKNPSNIVLDKTSTPVNLSGVEQIEFDIYIENYSDFVTYGIPGKLMLVLSSDVTNKDANLKAYRIRTLIRKDGWNHIVVDLSGQGIQTKGSLDLSSVKWAYLCYWDIKGYNPSDSYAATQTRIANLCGSMHRYNKDVPAYPDDASVEISKTGFAGTWGYEFDETKRLVYTPVKSSIVDLTNVDNVEFDIYIEDYEAFVQIAASGDEGGKNLLFTLSSGGYDKNQAGWRFHKQITHDGWNHVVIDLSSTKNYLTYADLSAVTHVGFQFYAGADTNFDSTN